MIDVYIGVGGNLGNKIKIISKAIDSLSSILVDLKCSRFYKTEPRDYFEQDYFLNVVIMGKTDLHPLDLLVKTQEIENGGGRVRNKLIPKGPRTIDIDILLYGSQVIDTKVLNIPHPEMTKRRFVLIPLLELEPDIVEPMSEIPFWKYLDKIEKQGVYGSSLYDYNNLFL